MKNRIVKSFVLVALFLFAGCQSVNKRPDWLDGTASLYPETEYLIAVGQGENHELAENNARANIAKIFVTKVEYTAAKETQSESYRQNGETRTETSSRWRDRTLIGSEKKLEGVEIREIWTDQNDRVYKLAVLDKLKVARIFAHQFRAADTAAMKYFQLARQSRGKLLTLRHFSAALGEARKRDVYYADYRFLYPVGKNIDFSLSAMAIKTGFNRFLDEEFRLSITTAGEFAGELKTATLEQITALGLKTASGAGERPDLKISVGLRCKTGSKTGRHTILRWALIVSILDEDKNKIVAVIKKNGMAAGNDLENAKQALIGKLGKVFQGSIGREMGMKIFGR